MKLDYSVLWDGSISTVFPSTLFAKIKPLEIVAISFLLFILFLLRHTYIVFTIQLKNCHPYQSNFTWSWGSTLFLAINYWKKLLHKYLKCQGYVFPLIIVWFEYPLIHNNHRSLKRNKKWFTQTFPFRSEAAKFLLL